MSNAVLPQHVSEQGGRPTGWQAWARAVLVVIVVAWTLTMIASLRGRFLDRFAVGTSHGNIGTDFFTAPRGFRNLTSGNNIFLTEIDDYGPYASCFLPHPMVAVAIGSWTAPLPPWIGYGVFVAVSLVLLGLSAWILESHFDDRLLRAFTWFALFCSLPTYVMLWNAQAHVLLILAVAMILGGLMGLERGGPGSAGSLRMLQMGLLISLLSKPLIVLALPALLAARETRRALLLPLAAYAAISALFLLTPALNSGGYNGIHWLNMLNASSSPAPLYSMVIPREYDLVNNLEIYCLPMYLYRLMGAPVGQLWLKLPVLAILAISVIPLVLASPRRRMRVLLATLVLCILSHYLCYYMVWEYHYTTLLPALPVLWWMSQGEQRPGLRWLLRIAFLVLLVNFLPTPYGLAPQTPLRFLAASTLLRVAPVLIAFACLVLYGVGSWRAALGEEPAEVPSPRRPWADLLMTGGVLAVLCGIVLGSVLVSVPQRLTKPLRQWTNNDWATHFEDMLTRPSRGLDPLAHAKMHWLLARIYGQTNPGVALGHYAAARERLPAQCDLLFEMGDLLLYTGQADRAASAYRRVLQLAPQHQAARNRLEQLRPQAERSGNTWR